MDTRQWKEQAFTLASAEEENKQLPKVAVVIPAKDEAERIANTVRAARALPYVDLIVVVDDGSTDQTQKAARSAGATTVRHTVNRGKASSMETGAKVVAMHQADGATPHLLLFLDADLAETAAEAFPLIEPVAKGEVDITIAQFPKLPGAGGHGFVLNLARKSIVKFTGWRPESPLSGQRCMTREAFEAAQPLADGWAVETAMTITQLTQGFSVKEVFCNLNHRVSKHDWASQRHRLHQYIDVWKAVMRFRLWGVPIANGHHTKLSTEQFTQVSAEQKPNEPYQIPGIRTV